MPLGGCTKEQASRCSAGGVLLGVRQMPRQRAASGFLYRGDIQEVDVNVRPDGPSLGGQYNLDDRDALLKGIAEVLPVSILLGDKGHIRVVPR